MRTSCPAAGTVLAPSVASRPVPQAWDEDYGRFPFAWSQAMALLFQCDSRGFDPVAEREGNNQTRSMVDRAELTPARDLVGEDERDTELLRGLAVRARSYLEGFDWTKSVDELWFADGIGGVVAVFLADITPARATVDPTLLVVVGDLRSLYLGVEEAPTAVEALALYTDLADDWVKAAMEGEPLDGHLPVGMPATKEHIEMLRSRVVMLRQSIIPWFRARPKGP